MYKYNIMKKLTPAKPMKPSKPAMPKKPMMPKPTKGSCGKSRGCWVKYDLPTC